ncbi:hypothetical protein BGW42_000087 [Actinomortierella wolfii]|nr:hypothetical protein BGW42_000087 [Actinomortierella wolfii]
MVNMITTQFDVLLFVGERQLVSCSVFVPVPSIVVKSHHILANNILPALPLPFPLSILRRPTFNQSPDSSPYPAIEAPPSAAIPSTTTTTTTALTTVSSNSGDTSSYRPDPGTACLKISLRPKPSFKFLRVHHYTVMTYEEEQHYFINRPIRLIPHLFSYPFPSDDEGQHHHHHHPWPSDVIVTGNFDQWQRTIHLKENKTLQRWEAKVDVNVDQLVPMGDHQRKLLYKFILDGDNWVTDPTQPLERDSEGNLNNVLLLDIEERFGTQYSETPHDQQEQESQQQQQESPQEKLQLDNQAYNQDDEDDTEYERKQVSTPTQTPVSSVAIDSVSASPATLAPPENEEEEDEDDKIIREYGKGMWGTPHFAINDHQDKFSHHFLQTSGDSARETESGATTASPSQQDLASHQILAEHKEGFLPTQNEEQGEEESMTTAGAGEDNQQSSPFVQGGKDDGDNNNEEEEDYDKVIGQSLWGTPHFQINDTLEMQDQFSNATSSLPPPPPSKDSVMTTHSTTPTLVASDRDSKPTQDTATFVSTLEPLAGTTSTTTTAAPTTDSGVDQHEGRKSVTSGTTAYHDEYDNDGDYGVVVLQGEPITSNTTALTTTPPPRSSIATTATVTATVNDLDKPAADVPTPAIVSATPSEGHAAYEKPQPAIPATTAATTVTSLVQEDSHKANGAAEASSTRNVANGKASKGKKKRSSLWKKIKKVLS